MDKAAIKEQREKLLFAARQGEKLSKDDRLYLATTPAYLQLTPIVTFHFDVIDLQPNATYRIFVQRVSCSRDEDFNPVFGVPHGAGYIRTDFDLKDLYGNIKKDRKTRVLGLRANRQKKTQEFSVKTKLGKLQVYYECRATMSQFGTDYMASSMSGDPRLSMQKEALAPNKVQYFCKSMESPRVDAFVFTVEWQLVEKKPSAAEKKRVGKETEK